MDAIAIIEAEVINIARQLEQAIANVNLLQGATQSAQHLLNRLKQEAAKVEADVKAEATKIEDTIVKVL